MFSKGKAGSRLYPDYLTTNFYVNEIVLGAGEHADVLKVQSKNSKKFYAVKRLLRTVQGAMERYASNLGEHYETAFQPYDFINIKLFLTQRTIERDI